MEIDVNLDNLGDFNLGPKTFTPRTKEPTYDDPAWRYYCMTSNTWKAWTREHSYNVTPSHVANNQYGYQTNPYAYPSAVNNIGAKGCTALYNCVSYVQGRINEIAGEWKYTKSWEGGEWFTEMPKAYPEWKQSLTPSIGAIACWKKVSKDGKDKKTTSGKIKGHVAVVEILQTPMQGQNLASGDRSGDKSTIQWIQ